MSNLIKEYRSKQHWGNPLWSFIHSICLDINIDVVITKNVLVNLQNCIPCYKCKNKYIPHMSILDQLTTKEELFKWSVDLHNEINKYFFKSEWSYEMAKEEWNNSSSSYFLWKFLHTVTIIDFYESKRYNEEVKEILVNLPNCILDQIDKQTFLNKLNDLETLDLSKKMVLFYWSIDVHNEVNKLNNKPTWNYEVALEKWANISCIREIKDVNTLSYESSIGPFGFYDNISQQLNLTGPSGSYDNISQQLQTSGPSGYIYSSGIYSSYTGPSGCCNNINTTLPIVNNE